MRELSDIVCPSCRTGLVARANVDYFTSTCPICETHFSVTRGEDGLCEVKRVRAWELPKQLLAVLP